MVPLSSSVQGNPSQPQVFHSPPSYCRSSPHMYYQVSLSVYKDVLACRPAVVHRNIQFNVQQ